MHLQAKAFTRCDRRPGSYSGHGPGRICDMEGLLFPSRHAVTRCDSHSARAPFSCRLTAHGERPKHAAGSDASQGCLRGGQRFTQQKSRRALPCPRLLFMLRFSNTMHEGRTKTWACLKRSRSDQRGPLALLYCCANDACPSVSSTRGRCDESAQTASSSMLLLLKSEKSPH